MPHEKFIKYGGVKFTNNTSPEEINLFVRNLPSEKKDNLYEVIKELADQGLITLHHEFSTIDDEAKAHPGC